MTLPVARIIASLFGLWDSVAVFSGSPSSFSMRLDFVRPRFLLKAGSTVLLCLLFASVSYAAPNPGRSVVGRACSANATKVRKLMRHPKSFGGPVALPSTRALAGLSDATARLHRGSRANLSDDDEAIQSDAAAAHIDIDDGSVPALRPLGILSGPVLRLRPTHTISPRSPRGPPTSI